MVRLLLLHMPGLTLLMLLCVPGLTLLRVWLQVDA
jgi:hypothetical protein